MRTLDCEGRRALLTGGTGSSTPVAARAALGAAASGTNSDITGLTGLTSAVPVTGGGTGLTAVATGDLLYGSAANIYTRLSEVAPVV